MTKYTIGVDVGGTNVKLGLVHSTGRIVERERFSTKDYQKSKAKLIKAIAESVKSLMASKKLKKSQIQGIGMGLPGLVDPQRGYVHILPNVPGWRNVPLKKMMEKHLGIRTYVDNDVNVITLAEWKYGAGKGCKNFILITFGTGVGGGLILNDQMYRGEGNFSGEVGHMPMEDQTFEKFVGNSYLIAKARKIFKNQTLELPDIYNLAKLDNVRAKQFWQEAGAYIGLNLAGIITLLNPKLIVLGGGVSNNYRFLKDSMLATIQKRAMKGPAQMAKIVRAKLGDDAGILGGQILVNSAKRR